MPIDLLSLCQIIKRAKFIYSFSYSHKLVKSILYVKTKIEFFVAISFNPFLALAVTGLLKKKNFMCQCVLDNPAESGFKLVT